MQDAAYDLDEAYQINGPEDARRMYGDWAPTYDDSFGAACGYIAPREIAAISRRSCGRKSPVAQKSWTSARGPAWSPNTCAG